MGFLALGLFLAVPLLAPDADGWNLLRILGFPRLGDFHSYVEHVRDAPGPAALAGLVVERRVMVLSAVPGLSIR
jgi:hypothetical protein